MTIAELTNFINSTTKAIMDAVNSCPELKDKYITMHVSEDGSQVFWNNSPAEEDQKTPKLNWYYISDEEGEGWTDFYA